MPVDKSFSVQNYLSLCYVPILCTTLALLIAGSQVNVLANEQSTENPLKSESQQQVAGFGDWLASNGPRHSHPLAAITPFGSNLNLLDLFGFFGSKKPSSEDDETKVADQQSNANVELEPSLDRLFAGPNEVDTVTSNKSGDNKKHEQRESSVVTNPKSPVILVPGYGGSRLEARLNKTKRVHYFCDLKSDWTDAWVNVKLLLPYMIDCLIDNLRLEYDYASNTTKNTAGVEIRVKNDEHISSVEYLNDIQINGLAYFAPIIEKLVTALNYTREADLLGAPYDFRKAPNEMSGYFERLQIRAEQLFTAGGLQPLTLICHSMGCNNLLYFLQRQPDTWKKTHIKRLISIAAPWGGCLMALRAAAMGNNLGMPYLFSESQLIKVQRSLPSTIYLFPHRKTFDNVPLIRTNVELSNHYNSTLLDSQTSSINLTPKKMVSRLSGSREQRTYFANDLSQFFDDIKHPDGYRMWLDTKDLLGSLEAPGVELWCLVGRGQKTLGRMEYLGDFPTSPSIDLYDDGDGTVTLQSARHCTMWSDEQKEPVHYQEFPFAHAEMLKEPQVLEQIEKILRL